MTTRPEQFTAEQVRAMYADRRYSDLLRARYEGRLDDYLAAVGEALTIPTTPQETR